MSRKVLVPLDMGANKITNAADGTAPSDVATVGQLPGSMEWLTVDTGGTYPVVREGSGGALYRSAGWNMVFYYPPEGATSFTLDVAKSLFAQIAPGSLLRVLAYAPVPGSYSWASTITALEDLVAAAAPYNHRFIFVLSTWGDGNELYNQTGQPHITSNAKTVAWITNQEYEHSVYGSNSLQDWVTTVVTAFADTPAVSIYDIMNEPSDGTTTNVTAWATYCSTMSGWIKAIAPDALVYMGTADLFDFIDDTFSNSTATDVSNYGTIFASLDIVNWHDYTVSGHCPLYLYDSINKPQILDEYGAYAKGHYGAYGDSDVDPAGLPAMSWEAQARYYELYLQTVFRNERTFAALAWSLTETDVNGGPYGDYDGTGAYEPINQARARQVIRDYPANDHPYLSPNTIGSSADILSWINSAQALRYPDGAVIYSGANSLQQNIFDMGPAIQITGPSTSAAAPVCRHKSVESQGKTWPSFQFRGAQLFNDAGGNWQDSGTATYFFIIKLSELPSGSGSSTYAYLISPTTNTGAAAIRITSTGAVQLEKYSAATGTGTLMATSTTLLTPGVPALVMVQFHSGTGYRVDVNTVPLSGSSATTYTATALQFGAAHDGTNGFIGHLIEFIKFNISLSEAQISMVNAYLTRQYGIDPALVAPAPVAYPVAVIPAITALVDGSSVPIDAGAGNTFFWSLGAGSHTLAAPSNPSDGQAIKIRIKYGGSYTPLFNSIFAFGASGAPTWTATSGKTDVVGFEYDASLNSGAGQWVYLGSTLGLTS